MSKHVSTLILFYLLSLSLLLGQYSGGFSLNDNVYVAFKLESGTLSFDEISMRQISLGNEIQVYMDAKTEKYMDGIYQVSLPGASGPIGTMHISKGLLHGECQLHYRKTLDRTMKYSRGLLDGETRLFHDDGTPKAVINYKKGKRQHAVYYHKKNGQIKGKQTYDAEGRAEGQVLTYDVDGNVIAETNSLEGKYHGKKMEYGDDKNQVIEHYDMGTLVGEYLVIAPNGKTKHKGNYDKNSKKTDKWIYYNDDGSTTKVEHYLNGELHGILMTYYPNDILKLWEEYQYGKLNGKRVEYEAEPHQMVVEGNYKEGKLDGEFKAYNQGELWRESMYKGGKMIREKQYLNGKIHILRIIDDQGKLVDVRKYDQAGKTTYRNQLYKKPDSLRLVVDASGIIDIE